MPKPKKEIRDALNLILDNVIDDSLDNDDESYITDEDITRFHNTQTVIQDSGESAFFLRELESIEARSYDTKYKRLKAVELLPVDTTDDPGADTTTYQRFTKVGIAKIIADYADDAPRVDVYGEEVTTKIYRIGDSFGYDRQEIRRSRMAGKSLDARRANTAKRASDEKINEIAWNGETDYSISGFIDYPGITEYTVPNGVGGDTEWNTKTPDEIVADMSGIVTAIIDSTNGVEEPDTMLMPIEQFEYINNTRMADGTDTTILQFFLKNNMHIKNIDWLVELSGAGAGGADRYMVYPRVRENVALKIPLPYTQLPPQQKGYGFEILTETRCAGVVVYYPQSVAFGDGI